MASLQAERRPTILCRRGVPLPGSGLQHCQVLQPQPPLPLRSGERLESLPTPASPHCPCPTACTCTYSLGPESTLPYSGINQERLHHRVMWAGEENWAALFQAAKDAPRHLLTPAAPTGWRDAAAFSCGNFEAEHPKGRTHILGFKLFRFRNISKPVSFGNISQVTSTP